MPPAFLNHRVPTACGTPTPTAASSLAVPAAIAAQNRRRSSRPATGGRPGENKRTRPERSDRRFRMLITTPVKGLRRPLESANWASITMKVEAGEAFTITWRSASQPTDSWSPNGVLIPPSDDKNLVIKTSGLSNGFRPRGSPDPHRTPRQIVHHKHPH